MTNPLLQKYEELYGKKEEPKKVPEDFKTKLAELRNTSTIIAAANPYISKLASYDNESLTDGFLQVAEKLKNKQAQVTSMNMEIDHQTRTQRMTFEVWDSF